jgi:hypothetical protein
MNELHNLRKPRERELVARHLLAHQEEIPGLIANRDWERLVCLAEFIANDVPRELAATDPALYRTLRSQVTELHIKGFGALNLEALRKLAAESVAP